MIRWRQIMWSDLPQSMSAHLPFTPIYDIQGSGSTAALTGTQTTKGVVVGDFETPTGSGQIQGLLLQDPIGDANAATSDGIFVYNAGRNNVNVGDLVRVTGTASDYQDQTQISAPAGGTIVCGTERSINTYCLSNICGRCLGTI